jgi:hypothetical protein
MMISLLAGHGENNLKRSRNLPEESVNVVAFILMDYHLVTDG